MNKVDRKKLLKDLLKAPNSSVYEHPLGYMVKGHKPTVAVYKTDGELDQYRENGVEVKLNKKELAKLDEILTRL